MERLAEIIGESIPEKMAELENLPILHRTVCSRDEMKNAVVNLLKGSENR